MSRLPPSAKRFFEAHFIDSQQDPFGFISWRLFRGRLNATDRLIDKPPNQLHPLGFLSACGVGYSRFRATQYTPRHP